MESACSTRDLTMGSDIVIKRTKYWDKFIKTSGRTRIMMMVFYETILILIRDTPYLFLTLQ